MKPYKKAEELSEFFNEKLGLPEIDIEKYEQFIQMSDYTKEYMLKMLKAWK